MFVTRQFLTLFFEGIAGFMMAFMDALFTNIVNPILGALTAGLGGGG